MGFWGFLKGIIPEKLINLEVDNRKIENAMKKFTSKVEHSIKDNRFTSPTGLQAQILEIKIKSSDKSKV